LKASSIKTSGDRAVYTNRFTIPGSSSDKNSVQGIYEDNTIVVDCKKPNYVTAERTVYNRVGERLFSFKYGEPGSLDLSDPFEAGSILAISQSIVCDEKRRTLVLSKRHFGAMRLSYLSNAPKGDGTISYGPISPTSDSTYPVETLFVHKFFAGQPTVALLPGQNAHGVSSTYTTFAQNLQINCIEKKLLSQTLEYYDKDENLIYLLAVISPQPLDVKSGSLFDSFLRIACAGNVAGNYEGINNAKYKKGGRVSRRSQFRFSKMEAI
jgi:hypothetical protein